MISRRGFLGALGAAFAAPAFVKADALMKIRGVMVPLDINIPAWCPEGWAPCAGQVVSKFQFPELYKSRRQHLFDKGDGLFKLPVGGIDYHPGSDKTVVSVVAVKPQTFSNGRIYQPGFMAATVVATDKIFSSTEQVELDTKFKLWVQGEFERQGCGHRLGPQTRVPVPMASFGCYEDPYKDLIAY